MPAGMSNANGGVPRSQPANTASQVAQVRVPFSRAAKEHTERGESRTFTISSAAQDFTLRVPVFGYLSALNLSLVCVTAGNAAAVAFNPDAPWNVIRRIAVRDVNGNAIINLSGYNAFALAKHGGYRLARPEAATRSFSQTTGAGATGGSFTAVLPLYMQFGRDALGVLANMDASAQYSLEITLGTTADIYSVAPTNPGTLTVSLDADYLYNPPAVDQFGNVNDVQPPGLNTVQYATVNTFSWSASGDQTLLLPRVGNLIRNIGLIFRTAAGARSDAAIPSIMQWEWDSSLMYTESVLARQAKNFRLYGFESDTGVLWYGRTADPDKLPIGEYGDEWLPTLGTTKLLLRFNAPVAGSVDVLVNDIAPVGNIFPMLPGGA